MPHQDPVNWQPIRGMPLIGRMIDSALQDTSSDWPANCAKAPSNAS